MIQQESQEGNCENRSNGKERNLYRMRKNELNSVSFGPQNQHLVLHCFLWEEYNYFLNLLVFGHEFGPELDNAVSLSGSQMSVHF